MPELPPILSEHRHCSHPPASSLKGTVGVCHFTDCSRVLGTLRSLHPRFRSSSPLPFRRCALAILRPPCLACCRFQAASPSHVQQFSSQCSPCSPSRPVAGVLLPAHHVLPPPHPGHMLLCDVPHAVLLKVERHHLRYLLASNDLLLFAFLNMYYVIFSKTLLLPWTCFLILKIM